MALSAVKTWAPAEILFASDLNAEFANIYSNGEDLSTPATKSHSMAGFELVMDGDGDSSVRADTDDRLDVKLQGQDLFRFDGTTASAVNGLSLVGAAAGSPAVVSVDAQGSSTNISLQLQPKGTGVVDVQSDLTVSGAATVAGNDVFDPLPIQVFGD